MTSDIFNGFADQKIKDNKLKKKKERFVDDLTSADGHDMPEGYLGISITSKRINIIFLLAIFIILIFFGRTIYLQILQGDYYRGIAEGNRVRILRNPG